MKELLIGNWQYSTSMTHLVT